MRFFVLFFFTINFLLLSVEIGDLQIIKSSAVENISANTTIIDFAGEKYNLLDEKSLSEFCEAVDGYSSLSEKFQKYFGKDWVEFKYFVSNRSFTENTALFRQLHYLFNETNSDNQISEIEKKLDKVISEKAKFAEEIKRLCEISSDKDFNTLTKTAEKLLMEDKYFEMKNLLKTFREKKESEKAEIDYLLSELSFITFDFENTRQFILSALDKKPNDIYFLKFYAYFLNDIGDAEKSIEIGKQILELEKNDKSAPDVNLSANYSSIGASFYKKGDYDKAIEYYQKALDITLKTLGENDPNTARNYNDLALAYDKKGDFDQAIFNYSKAIEIDLKTIGEKNVIVATNYNNLGSVYFKTGQFEKAIEYFGKAIEIDLKTVGKNNKNTASHYGNLGFVYLKKGDRKEASKCFKKVVNISRKLNIDKWVSFFEKKIEQIKK